MKIKDYVKLLLPEIIYLIVMVIYFINLDRLNKILLSRQMDSSIILLLYDNGKPIKYFAFALLLLVIGVYIIIKRINSIRFHELYFEEIIAAFISILLIVILLILLWVFINNPILRMIISALTIGAGVIYASSN